MRTLLPAAALLVLAACGDATSPTPRLSTPAAIAAALPGTYTLRGVNGAPPPQVLLVAAGDTVTLAGATLAFAANGTYSGRGTLYHSAAPSAASDVTSSGTWTVNGSGIALAGTSGALTGATTLTLGDDGTLTMDDTVTAGGAADGRRVRLTFRQ